MRKRKRKGVFLSIERYEQMIEDLQDIAIVAERIIGSPKSMRKSRSLVSFCSLCILVRCIQIQDSSPHGPPRPEN